MWSYISLLLYCPSVRYAKNIFFSFKITHRYRYISSQDGQSRRGNVFKKGNVIECSFILFRWHFLRVTCITSDLVCRAGSRVHFVFFKMKHNKWKLISLFLGWREGKKVWLHLWCCAGMERATLPNLSREDDKRQQHFFPPSIYGAKIHLLLQSLKKKKKVVTCGCLCNRAKIIQSEISLKVRTQPSVHIWEVYFKKVIMNTMCFGATTHFLYGT